MKKTFVSILSLFLISILYCTPIFASYSDCEHVGNTVKALEKGHFNIAFENGYNGFCITYGDEEADKDDEFTISNMELVVNNKSGENVSQYLKVLFVKYFNTLFEVDPTNSSYECADKISLQYYIWHFTDDFMNWRLDPELLAAVKQTVENQALSIPDHGYTIKINDTTLAVFDFHALKTHKAGQQNFFSYKITLKPYPAPQITTPDASQTITVLNGDPADLSVEASNAESYQWQVNKGDGNGFVDIQGATDSAYTTPDTTPTNVNYHYRCVVTNTAGNATSPEFSLNLLKKPVFTDPSKDQFKEVTLNQTVSFTVKASDADSYQWQVDKGDGNGFVNIQGATDSSYTAPETTEENIGYKYRCVASNLAGDTESPVFTLKQASASQPTGGNPSASQPTGGNPSGSQSNGMNSPVPQTGDSANAAWYLVIAFLSFIAAIVRYKKINIR